MNTALQTFQFDGIPVSVVDQNGEGWMIGEDIGKALDYSTPRESINKIFERNQEDLEEYSTEVKMTSVDGKERDIRVYNEEGVMMIGFFSKQPKAVTFRKWAVKILKDYRHKALPEQKAPSQQMLDMQNRLLDSQSANIAYLQEQLTKSQSHASGMYRLYEEEEAKVQRLLRARGKVKILERRDIFNKLDEGLEVPEIAKWLYRTPAFVKAVIKAGRYA